MQLGVPEVERRATCLPSIAQRLFVIIRLLRSPFNHDVIHRPRPCLIELFFSPRTDRSHPAYSPQSVERETPGVELYAKAEWYNPVVP